MVRLPKNHVNNGSLLDFDACQLCVAGRHAEINRDRSIPAQGFFDSGRHKLAIITDLFHAPSLRCSPRTAFWPALPRSRRGADVDLVGPKAVEDFFAPIFDTLAFVRHTSQVVDIEINGDQATATTMIIEYARPKRGKLLLAIGDYIDQIARSPRGWRFTRRELVTKVWTFLSEAPMTWQHHERAIPFAIAYQDMLFASKSLGRPRQGPPPTGSRNC